MLLVVLLDIWVPPVVRIDVTGKSMTKVERNRSDLESLSLAGPSGDRQRSGYRRDSTSRMAFVGGAHDPRGAKDVDGDSTPMSVCAS